jgi:hypothetical protein
VSSDFSFIALAPALVCESPACPAANETHTVAPEHARVVRVWLDQIGEADAGVIV